MEKAPVPITQGKSVVCSSSALGSMERGACSAGSMGIDAANGTNLTWALLPGKFQQSHPLSAYPALHRSQGVQ